MDKVDVYLDPLFPVVLELAESSANRQTKVLACELLHALVVYLVGTAASATDQLAPQKQGHQLVKLLAKVLAQ